MPKPLKHVFVCTQSRPPGHPRGSCQRQGCMSVMDEFIQEMQRRNLFAQIAVTNAGCLGPCQYGANVLIYPDGVMYGKVTREDVKIIIDEHLLGGQIIQHLCVPTEVWG